MKIKSYRYNISIMYKMSSFFDSNIVISSDDPMLKVYIDSLKENNKSLQQDIDALEMYIDGLENTLQTLNNTDLFEKIDQLEKKLLKVTNENKNLANNDNINKIQILETKLSKVISQKEKMEHDYRVLMDQTEETNKKDTENYISIIKELQEAKNKLHNICENNTYMYQAIGDEISNVMNNFTIDSFIEAIANIADLVCHNPEEIMNKIDDFEESKRSIKTSNDLWKFLAKYDGSENIVKLSQSPYLGIVEQIQLKVSEKCLDENIRTQIMQKINEFITDNEKYNYRDELKKHTLKWILENIHYNLFCDPNYLNNFCNCFDELINNTCAVWAQNELCESSEGDYMDSSDSSSI